MEDPSQTPALEFTWSESSLYSILLSTLNIDTRVMVNIFFFGYKLESAHCPWNIKNIKFSYPSGIHGFL